MSTIKNSKSARKYRKSASILRDIICEVMRVDKEIAFCDDTRKREYVNARQIFCNVFYSYTKNNKISITLEDIGKLVYLPKASIDVDHATVLHSIKTVERDCSTDISLKHSVDNIIAYFNRAMGRNSNRTMLLHHSIMNERPKRRINQRLVIGL